MNASERIRFITDIANQLSGEEWDVIDLTLRQFNLPWTDEWGGEKRAYVVEMIQEVNDEQLISLAEHLKITNHTISSTLRTSMKEALKQVELQKSLMISVSTGGPRIQAVDDEYRERKLEIASSLHDLQIEDPNPYPDLWSWYGKWSDGSLPTYQSRRQYVSILTMLDSRAESLSQPRFTRTGTVIKMFDD